MNWGGGWEKEGEELKYVFERCSWGEDVNVDSVTNSGLQCTDFFMLPGDGSVPSGSDPDPDPAPFAAAASPFGLGVSVFVSGFGCSMMAARESECWGVVFLLDFEGFGFYYFFS